MEAAVERRHSASLAIASTRERKTPANLAITTATCGSVTQPPRCSQMQARQRPQRAWSTERANQDADIAGRECGVTKGGKVWRQLANDFANESVENSPTLANSGRHETARRVLSSLVDDHQTSSDNTGRTARLTLSRWRHGFESRTGCEESPVQRHSPECLLWFPPCVANGVRLRWHVCCAGS